jgi:hypothetical protein
VVVLLVLVGLAGGGDDEAEQVASGADDPSATTSDAESETESDTESESGTGSDDATTTTERVTTTVPTTTTTVDPEVLRAEYDAQVAASCETVAAASLVEDDGDLARREGGAYVDRWESHAPRDRFLADVEYCGRQRRDERRANECGARPDVGLLNRDPDRFIGQCFTVVFRITQFDQATGPCGFRAYFDTVPREWNFEYEGDNSIVLYDEPCPALDPLGPDDVLRTRVVVIGGLTYDTSIGGSATAVQFHPLGDPEIIANN